jgi:hypothetical protein
MFEDQPRQARGAAADETYAGEELPDLHPLRAIAEAAEWADAASGLTDAFGGPLPARHPLHPLACAVARALTEAGFTLHHCARQHPLHRLGGVCLLPVASGHDPEGRSRGVLDDPRPAGTRPGSLERIRPHPKDP